MTFDLNGHEHCLICQKPILGCTCLPLTIHYVSLFMEKMTRLESQLAAVRKAVGELPHDDVDCVHCKLLTALGDRK